ncbi:MAG: hypothetical protein AAGK22_02820 [Acidobacteriota bacterium]
MKAAARLAALLVATALSILLLLGALPLAQPALASTSASAVPELTTVLVRIVVEDAAGKRTYELITTNDGAARRLESASRVALGPRPRSVPEGTVPIRTVQYQDLGFSADLTVRQKDAQRYRVQAKFQDSVVNESVEADFPQIDRHSQELHALVALGESVTATSVAGGKTADYRITIELGEL